MILHLSCRSERKVSSEVPRCGHIRTEGVGSWFTSWYHNVKPYEPRSCQELVASVSFYSQSLVFSTSSDPAFIEVASASHYYRCLWESENVNLRDVVSPEAMPSRVAPGPAYRGQQSLRRQDYGNEMGR
jgi:hypothetical protein